MGTRASRRELAGEHRFHRRACRSGSPEGEPWGAPPRATHRGSLQGSERDAHDLGQARPGAEPKAKVEERLAQVAALVGREGEDAGEAAPFGRTGSLAHRGRMDDSEHVDLD